MFDIEQLPTFWASDRGRQIMARTPFPDAGNGGVVGSVEGAKHSLGEPRMGFRRLRVQGIGGRGTNLSL